jgi:glycosyltransferase involved in cell wall biosynthesis
MKKQTICLNMIVKNESHVIERCLTSVKPWIDYWVIVDTGSTDGTQKKIRDFLQDISGELYERQWVNFSHNRNEALRYAHGKGDYLLLIDADDCLEFEKNFKMPYLTHDCYYVLQHIQVNQVNFRNKAYLFLKNTPEFKWIGPLHETIYSETPKSSAIMDGVINRYLKDGSRGQDPNQHLRDLDILKKALEKDPADARSLFYLAIEYLHMNDNQKALESFEKMAAMNSSKDETYYALFCIGVLQIALKMSSEIFLNSLCKAYQFDPERIEPLYEMAQYFIHKQEYILAYLVSKHAIEIPCPIDKVFVEPWRYEWGIWVLYLVSAEKTNCRTEALIALKRLKSIPDLPSNLLSQLAADLPNLFAQI